MSLDDTLSPEVEFSKLRAVIILLILVGGLCQLTVAPSFLPGGYEVPISLLVLLGGFLVLLLSGKLFWIPSLNRSQGFYLATLALGLAATPREALPLAVLDVARDIALIVIAAWTFQSLAERERALVGRFFGWACPVLLIATALQLHALPQVQISQMMMNTLALISLPFFVSVIGPHRLPLRLAGLIVVSALAGYTFSHGALILIWVLLLVLSLWRLLNRPVALILLAIMITIGVSSFYTQAEVHPWRLLKTHHEVDLTIEQQLELGVDELHLPTRRHLEAKTSAMGLRWLPLGAGPGLYDRGIAHLDYFVEAQAYNDDTPIQPDAYNQYLVTLVEDGPLAAIALGLLFFFAMFHCMMLDDEFDNTGEIGPAPHSVVGLSLLGVFLAASVSLVLAPGTGVWVGALLGLSLFSQLQPPRHIRLSRLLLPMLYLVGGFYAAQLLNTVDDEDPRTWTVTSQFARAALFNDDSYPFGLQQLELEDAPATDQLPILQQAEEWPGAAPIVAKAEAEHGAAVALTADDEAAAEITATVTLPAAGRYRLATRLYWLTEAPSHLIVQTGEQQVLINGGLLHQWYLTPASALFELEAGTHTLRFQARRGHLLIDAWQLIPVD